MEFFFGIAGSFVFLGAVCGTFLVFSALIALASVLAFQLVLGFIALFKAKIQYALYFVFLLFAFFIANGCLAFYIGQEYFVSNKVISFALLILSSVWFFIYIYLNMPLISPFEPKENN